MEDRPQINLYIETSIKGPRVQDGWYIYVLEYILEGNRKQGMGRGRQRERQKTSLP